jgi:hypothetical protein
VKLVGGAPVTAWTSSFGREPPPDAMVCVSSRSISPYSVGTPDAIAPSTHARGRRRRAGPADGRLPIASAASAGEAERRRAQGDAAAMTIAPRGWSLYGAPWLQPVAIAGKSTGPRNRENKRNPLPPAATGCLRSSMVSRASAVGCHPLREVPSLRRRRSIPVGIVEPDYLLVQSGHGPWSQPQPVHAWRITRASYPFAASGSESRPPGSAPSLCSDDQRRARR